MISLLRHLLSDQRGATVIEYTLIATLIGIAAISSITTVGHRVMNLLNPVWVSLN